MAIAIVPIIFALLGALVYTLADNPKAAELGRLTFACGMFTLAFAFATTVLRIG